MATAFRLHVCVRFAALLLRENEKAQSKTLLIIQRDATTAKDSDLSLASTLKAFSSTDRASKKHTALQKNDLCIFVLKRKQKEQI